MDQRSTYDLLGLPGEFGTILLVLGLALSLSPYLSGADFGIFKVPELPPPTRRGMRVGGPVMLAVAILLFLPIWSPAPLSSPLPATAATPREEPAPPAPPVGDTAGSAGVPAAIAGEGEASQPSAPSPAAGTFVVDSLEIPLLPRSAGFFICLTASSGSRADTFRLPRRFEGEPLVIPVGTLQVPGVAAGQGVTVRLYLDRQDIDALCSPAARFRAIADLTARGNGVHEDALSDFAYRIVWRLEEAIP